MLMRVRVLLSELAVIRGYALRSTIRQSGYCVFWRCQAIVVLFIGSLALGSCASGPSISTDVDYCCRSGAESIRSYRIEFEDMPEFLKPMLRDEASIALDSKGLEYTEGDGDAVLTMTYIHWLLSKEEDAREVAWGTLSPGGDSRFIAKVHVALKNSVTREVVWSGTMSKYHYVAVGSYMHAVPARSAMRKAFNALFADYPNRILEEF
jgi:hypothetical protein